MSVDLRDARFVIGGVSGAGKSTIGRALATHLDLRFVDADDLHPTANIDRMKAGIPLTDTDRRPWLDIVGTVLAEQRSTGIVVACSALKRAYREHLSAYAPTTWFVELEGSPDLLRARLRAREGHFMPPTLLSSQLDALEPIGSGERGFSVDISQLPIDIIANIVQTVERRSR